MKKLYLVFILILFLLTGCQNIKEFPNNPIIFKTGELNFENEESGYKAIEYNDKI